jgi:hypothetical protein
MDEKSGDPLAEFLAKRREAHRQRMIEELLERFRMAMGREPASPGEIRAFIAKELAAARAAKKGKQE